MRTRVEVCVGSVAEARSAAALGAHSVEVCSWLPAGGVTPSFGMVQVVRNVQRGITRVLIRPSAGSFVYGADEKEVILRDVERFATNSPCALVVGALDANGLVDTGFLREVMAAAPAAEFTFHRAIDQSGDIRQAFEQCVDLGFHRVLTSGGARLAMDAQDHLTWMVAQAPKAVSVAAAGGVTPKNVVELVERTGVPEVHFAAQRSINGPALKVPMNSTGPDGGLCTGPDEEKIRGVIKVLTDAGL